MDSRLVLTVNLKNDQNKNLIEGEISETVFGLIE